MKLRFLTSPLLSFVLLGLGQSLTLSESEREKLTGIGDEVTQKLLGQLKSSLLAALKEGGPIHAIRFCNVKALPLTQEVARSYPGIRLKRTSLKVRNPENAPDRHERKVLDRFQELAASGQELPPNYVEKISRSGDVVYRYYSPLRTNDFCLTCHGERSSLQPDLAKALQELYPEDKAVGYGAGDFRGVISVELPGL